MVGFWLGRYTTIGTNSIWISVCERVKDGQNLEFAIIGPRFLHPEPFQGLVPKSWVLSCLGAAGVARGTKPVPTTVHLRTVRSSTCSQNISYNVLEKYYITLY